MRASPYTYVRDVRTRTFSTLLRRHAAERGTGRLARRRGAIWAAGSVWLSAVAAAAAGEGAGRRRRTSEVGFGLNK